MKEKNKEKEMRKNSASTSTIPSGISSMYSQNTPTVFSRGNGNLNDISFTDMLKNEFGQQTGNLNVCNSLYDVDLDRYLDL